jgi:hypothetical protein
MKRIISLDFVRGLFMLFLIFVHTFETTIEGSFIDNIFNMDTYLVVIFGLFMLFASWRGLFLIVSGAAHTYSVQKSIDRNESSRKILFNQFVTALIFFLHGMAIQVFWNPYSGLYGFFQTGIWDPFAWSSNLQWVDAVQTIAICAMLSSIIQLLISRKKGKEKYLRNYIIYACIIIITIAITPYIVDIIESKYGFTPQNIQSVPFTTWGNRFNMMWLAMLVGYQEPLLPYFGVYCIGNILGMALARPNANKKKINKAGYLSGIIIIAIGFLVWAVKDHFAFAGMFMIPPTWFLIVNAGLQLMFILFFINFFEFGKNLRKKTNKTKIIRRAGLLSLTLFTYQPLCYIPRWILSKITGWDCVGFYNLDILESLVCCIVVLCFWILLLYLFGLIKNYLTPDWFFSIIRSKINGKKINWVDPLNDYEIIKNPEFTELANNSN